MSYSRVMEPGAQRKGRELQDAYTFCCENEQSCRSPKLYWKKRLIDLPRVFFSRTTCWKDLLPTTHMQTDRYNLSQVRWKWQKGQGQGHFKRWLYSLRESYYSSLIRPLFESNDPWQNLMRFESIHPIKLRQPHIGKRAKPFQYIIILFKKIKSQQYQVFYINYVFIMKIKTFCLLMLRVPSE